MPPSSGCLTRFCRSSSVRTLLGCLFQRILLDQRSHSRNLAELQRVFPIRCMFRWAIPSARTRIAGSFWNRRKRQWV